MKLKTPIAITLLTCSAVSYAGHPAEDNSLPLKPPVTIPQQIGSWSIAIEGLYLRPANGDYEYALTIGDSTISGINTTENIEANKVSALNPEYDWGGRLDVKYLFPGNGRDINVVWTHFHHDDVSHRNRIDGAIMLSRDLQIATPETGNLFTNGWDTARSKSTNHYNSVDLVWAQRMDFGRRVTLRAFGGARYADIDMADKGRFSAVDVDNNEQSVAYGVSRYQSDFQGFGPRAGMDAQVHLMDNVMITGVVAGSLLTGDLDHKWRSSLATVNEVTGDTDLVVNTHRIHDTTIVVPELDTRIGFSYTHALSPDSAVSFEVGYEYTNYFDPKAHSELGYLGAMSHNNYFAIHGPYGRIQLDVA